MKLFKQLLGSIAICALSVHAGYAQLNPLSSQYYTNRYLANPAFAGWEQDLKLNAAYRKLWSDVSGAPLTQNLTVDYGFNRVGVGLTVNYESAGLLRETRVMGSYAYHLKLNGQNDQLHFGLSIGFMNQWLDNADITGNPNDPLIGQYRDRKAYFDGDFGLAYTSEGLNLQAALLNLKSTLKKDVIRSTDAGTFYTAASYRIKISEGSEGADAEPMLVYRGLKGLDNIWDAGAQLSIANRQVFLLGMYHSTKNATFGFGADFKKKYLISGTYTTQTSALSSYTNGSFELNLRLKI